MGTIESGETKEYIIKTDTEQVFETPIVQGKLNSVIIDSSERVSVTLTSSLGYLILHNSSHHGIRYYAPRAIMQGPIENVIVNDQFDKFLLNEPIEISVSGPKSEVTIILRIS